MRPCVGFSRAIQHDYEPAIEALDPDVDLWLDPQTLPESGPFRGRDAVVTRLAEVVSSFADHGVSARGAESSMCSVVVASRGSGSPVMCPATITMGALRS